MTRVIGILVWHRESPLWLAALIASAKDYIDHWICVDGAYALYSTTEKSLVSEAQTIVETCQAIDAGVTLHRPQGPWVGNEVAKRNYAFRAAELEAEPNVDWYFVLDADILIDRGIPDLRERLADTTCDAAEVMVIERGDPYRNPARLEHESKVAMPADHHYPLRALFRAIPGMRCDRAHYFYAAADGRKLWGYTAEQLEPALDLHDLRIEHRTHHRPLKRHQDAQAYYRRRDAAGVEAVAA